MDRNMDVNASMRANLRFAGIAALAVLVLSGCTSTSQSSNAMAALDCDDRFTRCAPAVSPVSPSVDQIEMPAHEQADLVEQTSASAVPIITPPTVAPIRFEFDASTAMSVNLRSSAEFLMRHPTAQVTLHGYTDPLGSDDYNLELAGKRAAHIRERLMIAGVDRRQITVQSHGEQGLLVAEIAASQVASKEALVMLYAPNRRVTLEFALPSSLAQLN